MRSCEPHSQQRRRQSQPAAATTYHRGVLLSCLALIATVSFAIGYVGNGIAQEASGNTSDPESSSSRVKIREKQLDVSLEAREIERILGKLKRASDLSKQRITDAAQKAESASGALERGDSQAARTEAQEAAAMFQEIMKQLEALLAEDTPQRVAAAQNLAQKLSRLERQFLDQLPPGQGNPGTGGKGKVDPQSKMKKTPNQNQQTAQGAQGTGEKKQTKNEGSGKGNDRNAKAESKPGEGSDQNKRDPHKGDPDKGDQEDGKGKKDDEKSDGTAGGGEKKDVKSDDSSGGGEKKQETDEPKDGSDAGKDKPDSSASGTGEQQDRDDQGAGSAQEMSEEQQREALARRAEELAESGKTLEDILSAIRQSTEPADAEAVKMVDALLKETNLNEAIAGMQQAANAIRAGELEEVRVTSGDVADRLEIAAQRLGSAYRLIVAPQAEELRKLEQALADLRDELQHLETPAQIAAWHREARELLDELDRYGVNEEIRQKLLEEMEKAGVQPNTAAGEIAWRTVEGLYVAPANYQQILGLIQEDLQLRLQNLLIGDLSASPDDVTPPKYQELVERYYQVLSRESGRKAAGKK